MVSRCRPAGKCRSHQRKKGRLEKGSYKISVGAVPMSPHPFVSLWRWRQPCSSFLWIQLGVLSLCEFLLLLLFPSFLTCFDDECDVILFSRVFCTNDTPQTRGLVDKSDTLASPSFTTKSLCLLHTPLPWASLFPFCSVCMIFCPIQFDCALYLSCCLQLQPTENCFDALEVKRSLKAETWKTFGWNVKAV